MGNADFGCFTETHGDKGKELAANLDHINFRYWWAHYPDSHNTGGIMICVRKSFLEKFHSTTEDNWTVGTQGRTASLRLDGPKGG